jgi:hypothetical protein
MMAARSVCAQGPIESTRGTSGIWGWLGGEEGSTRVRGKRQSALKASRLLTADQ